MDGGGDTTKKAEGESVCPVSAESPPPSIHPAVSTTASLPARLTSLSPLPSTATKPSSQVANYASGVAADDGGGGSVDPQLAERTEAAQTNINILLDIAISSARAALVTTLFLIFWNLLSALRISFFH